MDGYAIRANGDSNLDNFMFVLWENSSFLESFSSIWANIEIEL